MRPRLLGLRLDRANMQLLFFGCGVLSGVAAVAFAPGAPWSSAIEPLGATSADALDLAAQRSMAAAAWWMVIASTVGAVAGVGSLLFLRVNLIEARRVTREAIRSADASERSIQHAIQVHGDQLEMGRKQLRAYCVVKSVVLSQLDRVLQVKLTLTNSGQSPAFSPRVDTMMLVEVGDTEDIAFELADYLPDIAVGDHEEADYVCRIEQIYPTSELARRIIVQGTVNYRDIFDELRAEPFSFRIFLRRPGPLPMTVMGKQPVHHNLRMAE